MNRLLLAAMAAAVLPCGSATAQTAAPPPPPPPPPPRTSIPSAAVPTTLQRTSFVYATRDGGQRLSLDRIVDPAVKVAGKRPVIIFSYGGGWETGSRSDPGFAGLLTPYTALGYAVIAIDYRLGIRIAKQRNEFTPANATQMYLRAIQWGVEDLFDATAFVLRHADAWGIDPAQIVIMGGSAGATNSLVAEYHVANATPLARTRLPAAFRYAGVVSMAGAFWLPAGTPLTFRNRPAPIMFFHGARDQLVTYDEVQGPFSGYGPAYYFRRFAGPAYPKWFVDYPQGDHVIAGVPATDSTNEIVAFLEKLVQQKQRLSIHMIEESDPPKDLSVMMKAMVEAAERAKAR